MTESGRMQLREQLETERVFLEDEKEDEFREGLEEGLAAAEPEGLESPVQPVVFDGIQPGLVGKALGLAFSGSSVLLASDSWGSWTWSAVESLSKNPLPKGSILLRTGGSSGEAKFAVHSLQSLEASALNLTDHLGAAPLSSVLDLPLYHVSGWMPVVRAIVSGGRVATHWSGLDLPGKVCCSVVPTTLFRSLQSSDRLSILEQADIVFAGGASFSESLFSSAREKGIRLSLVYGMTETAAMVAMQDPAAFLDGEAPSLKPIGSNKVRCAADGEIQIQSSQLFYGYWGRPFSVSGDGWWSTGDYGKQFPDGSFVPLGRKGRFAESGGETVSLEKVEAVVSGLNGVQDHWLSVQPDDEWGSKLILFLVAERERDWRELLKDQLDSGEVPAEVRVVGEIPRGESGKVDPDALFG